MLAGSLLVGASVRASLARLATRRLGRTDVGHRRRSGRSREALAARLRQASAPAIAAAAPILALQGIVRHPTSGRRAAACPVYGVDERFFAFHGVDGRAAGESDAFGSVPASRPSSARRRATTVLVRVARPTDIPVDSLHGRKDEVGRTMRLRSAATLDPAAAWASSRWRRGRGRCAPCSSRSSRLQRDLDARRTRQHDAAAPATASARPRRRPCDRRCAVAGRSTSGLEALTVRSDGPNARRRVVGRPDCRRHRRGDRARRRAAGRCGATPVLTWLANAMTVGGRSVPYSLVTAIGPDAAGDPTLARAAAASTRRHAADRAQRVDGARISAPRPATRSSSSTTAGPTRAGSSPSARVPRRRRRADARPRRRSAAGARLSRHHRDRKSFADWDPPFPIDLSCVRPQDEDVLGSLPHDAEGVHSARGRPAAVADASRPADVDARAVQTRRWRDHASSVAVDCDRARRGRSEPTPGFTRDRRARAEPRGVRRRHGLRRVFLVLQLLPHGRRRCCSPGLFFRLSLEQRLSQIGVLRAAGFSLGDVRRVFLIEGARRRSARRVLGVGLAIGWAALMMYGLRTWWVDAVGTTRLDAARRSARARDRRRGRRGRRASSRSCSRCAASAATSPRAAADRHRRLLVADSSRSRARRVAIGALGAAGARVRARRPGRDPGSRAAFFGAGALVLDRGPGRHSAAGCDRARPATRLTPSIGPRPAGSPRPRATRRGGPAAASRRSGLVAAAVFLLVSVDAFRKRVGRERGRLASGTGGFALIAESALPIVHDLSSPEGRRAAGLDDAPGSPLRRRHADRASGSGRATMRVV